MAAYRRVPIAIVAPLLIAAAIGVTALVATRASAHTGHSSGLEFQLSILSAQPCPPGVNDGKLDCPAQQYLDGTFTVGVWLSDTSGIAQSSFYETGFTLSYAGFGISSLDDPAIVWPECVDETLEDEFGEVGAECTGANSSYNGLIGTAGFRCSDFNGGVITLVHGPGETYVVDSFGVMHTDAGPDSLSILCIDIFTTYTPTPTRTPRATLTPTPIPVGGLTGLTNAGPPAGGGGANWWWVAVPAVGAALGAAAFAYRRVC